MISIGILREEKVLADARVILNPKQIQEVMNRYPVIIMVQASNSRAFSDDEYRQAGIPVVDDVSDCDILLGIKEVPIEKLIDNKTYFIFSHTIKEQERNKSLLQSILQKNITLVDYEVLRNSEGKRVIAFGYFAGMVGAHNAIWTYFERNRITGLKRMHEYFDYDKAKASYKDLKLPLVKLILTGTGRVGSGAAKVLDDMGFQRVSLTDFEKWKDQKACYCQLTSKDYIQHKLKKPFDKSDFYTHPENYKSTFSRFINQADILINGIFWDNNAPKLFSRQDMVSLTYKMKVIADITCDIAPMSSVPSTLRASTIKDPVYGYDPKLNQEVVPYGEDHIDVMAIDNLPSELPRDASTAFGEQFIEHVLPELFKKHSFLIEGATIAKGGKLGKDYSYLKNYAGVSNPT